jgi:hypothetical protein
MISVVLLSILLSILMLQITLTFEKGVVENFNEEGKVKHLYLSISFHVCRRLHALLLAHH